MISRVWCYPSRLFNGGGHVRNYSNIISRSLKYVKEVDEQQHKLAGSSVQSKIDQLVARIASNKEMLYLLALFHSECKKVGITRQDDKRHKSLRFYLSYYFRLKPIHQTFWDTCHLMNIANHNHKIRCDPQYLGLMDPKNFDEGFLKELETGEYKGVGFKDVEAYAGSVRPDWRSPSDAK